MSADEKRFAAKWQTFHLAEKKNKDQPARHVEALRGILQQVTIATKNKMVPPMAGLDLYLQESDRYAAVMDTPEEEGGVNNYADGVLKLLSGHGNRSKEWSSSLTDQSRLTSLPCVQKFLLDTQKASEHLLPPDHENLRLDLKDTRAEEQEHFKKLLQQRAAERDRNKQQSRPKQPASHATFPYQGASSTNTAAFNQIGSEQRQPLGSSSGPGLYKYPPRTGTVIEEAGQNRYPPPPPPSAFSHDGDRSRPVGENSRFMSSAPSSHRRGEQIKRKQCEDDEEEMDENETPGVGIFKTARDQLIIDQRTKYRNRGGGASGGGVNSTTYGSSKKSLGTRRGINSKFVPPVLNRDEDEPATSGGSLVRRALAHKGRDGGDEEEEIDERLKNIDPKMVEVITNEIMDHGAPVAWDDIAGLDFAKKTIKEIVVWPMLRPDIFTGLRGPPKGLLLFGPPGTGKTLIGKCIASQSKSTFFSISASSLTSKWIGDGEKMVRALFAVARVHQPAVIFIDEIDSLLAQRSSDENEASRRIKTEFLVQLDGATTGEADRILVVGATNRPQEIDEAARRRFVKRLYIPLPEASARQRLVQHLLNNQAHHLTDQQLMDIVTQTDGYSGADMANLCREAALGPIRSVDFEEIENLAADQVRPILYEDFECALKQVRASVSQDDLELYIDWNKQYGSWAI